MTDPSTVSAQIAAIKARSADWHRDEQGLAEAAEAWGGGCNEHGVFATCEAETVARLGDACRAEVLIAQGGNRRVLLGPRRGALLVRVREAPAPVRPRRARRAGSASSRHGRR